MNQMGPENLDEAGTSKKRDKKRKNVEESTEMIVLDEDNANIGNGKSAKIIKNNDEELNLVKRFKLNEKFFETCIDLIPTNIYLNNGDRLNWLQMIDNKNNKRSIQVDEELNDENDEASLKAQKQKFNPFTFKSVTQIYKELGNIIKPIKTQMSANYSLTKKFEENFHANIKIENKNKSKKSLKEKKKSELKEKKRTATNKKQKNKKSKVKSDERQIEAEGSTPASGSPRTHQKPILNKNGSVVYSKFDFSVDNVDKKLQTKKSKNPTANVKPKDYKNLVKKLQEKKEKFNELKESKPEEALRVETEDKWKNVMDRASGVKVKDDIGMLKKSIKRIEKKKVKSKKEWSERVKTVGQRQKATQDKRQKNIEDRKNKKKEKKISKLKKKGRIVTGF